MTTLAIGSSATCTPRDGGTIAIATNGGFGSVVVTPTGGAASTVNFGPAPIRQIFGPYSEGASIVITNASCNSLDYDAGGGGFDPSSVAITGGTIGGLPVFRVSNRLGMLRTALGFHNTITGGGATNSTFQQIYSCPVPFYAVQILYANGTAVDMTQAADQLKCSVAATQQITDRLGPWQGGSRTTNLTALTFGGNTFPALPAASSFAYSYSLSDVAEVPSVAPTDGTAEYKLMVRTWKNLAGIPFINQASGQAVIRSITGSDVYSDILGTGDFTASNPGSINTADSSFQTSVGAIFHTAQKYATILAVGDSISGGTGTSGIVMGYPVRAKIALQAAGKPVGLIATGVSGSTSNPGYISRAKAAINAGLQPTFCIFPIQTINDPGNINCSTTQTQNRISVAVQFAEYLADRGIIPIIVGPVPYTAILAAGVASYNTFEAVGPVLAAAVGGAYVSSLAMFSTGAAGFYNWANGADTADGTHPSDQGAQKLGALVATAISAYL
jgi:lysophospholipase L1-like esterase